MTHTRRPVRAAVLLAAGGLLVAACGSSAKQDARSTTPSTQPATTTAPATDTTSPAAPRSTAAAGTALIAAGHVTGDATTITFGAAFVKALYTRGINTAPTGRAGLDDTHRAQLPITSGNATLYGATSQLDRMSATLHHAGSGLRVTSRSTTVSVTDIVVSLGSRPAVTATLAVTSTTKPSSPSTVRLFDLDLTRPAVKSGDGVTLSGITARLDPQAARELDAAFGTTLFTGFGSRTAGTVSVTVTP